MKRGRWWFPSDNLLQRLLETDRKKVAVSGMSHLSRSETTLERYSRYPDDLFRYSMASEEHRVIWFLLTCHLSHLTMRCLTIFPSVYLIGNELNWLIRTCAQWTKNGDTSSLTCSFDGERRLYCSCRFIIENNSSTRIVSISQDRYNQHRGLFS